MTFKETLRDLAQHMQQEVRAVEKFLLDTIQLAKLVWIFATLVSLIIGHIVWAAFSLIQQTAFALEVAVPTFGIATMQNAPWVYYAIIPAMSILMGLSALVLVLWSELFAFASRRPH